MNITINSKPVDTTLENETEVGEIVNQIATWIRESDQYVCEIAVDDTQYSPRQEEIWSPIKIENVTNLNVQTFSRRELEECLRHLSEISVMIQGNRGEEAMQAIITLSDLMSGFLRIVPRMEPAHQKELRTNIEALNGSLSELVGGFESQDTVLIADLVEYEVVPSVKRVLGSLPVSQRLGH